MSLSLTDAEAIYLADFAAAKADGGKLKIYDGAVPANADASTGASNVLATFYLQTPAYNAASMVGNEAVAVIKTHLAYTFAGTASYYRIENSGGTTIRQGGLDDLNLSGTTFANGDQVRIPS